MVAIETVSVFLLQVDIIEAGATVYHGIIDNKALEVQYSHKLAGFHRHTINVETLLCLRHHLTVHQVVAAIALVANKAATGTVKIHQHLNFEFGSGCLGRQQFGKYFASGLIVFQIECRNIDSLFGATDPLNQGLFEVTWGQQPVQCIRRYGNSTQLIQQGILLSLYVPAIHSLPVFPGKNVLPLYGEIDKDPLRGE